MIAVTESKAVDGRMLTGEDLLRAGQSVKVLAITVIVLLSAGVIVLAVAQWLESGVAGQMFRTDGQVVYGFAFLMLLTVGYLVGKGRSTARSQRAMIAQLLEEESVIRARRLDPILEYHHPELCREILRRQANCAARISSAITLVEMTIPEFGKLALEGETRPVVEEFYQEIRRQCRPLDFWLRWNANSFLLVLLEVPAEETAGVVYRLRSRLQQWWRSQTEISADPHFQWHYRTVGSLGASGEILREVRSLMEHDQFVATPMDGVWQSKADPPAAAFAGAVEKGGTLQ